MDVDCCICWGGRVVWPGACGMDVCGLKLVAYQAWAYAGAATIGA